MPSDLKTLSGDLRRLSTAIVTATNDVTRKVATEVFTEAIRRSSGTKTAKDRREADYPFARRHGAPVWDVSTINVGTGEFRMGWAIDSVPGPNGLILRGVSNHSEVAPYLEQKDGAPKSSMFARPLVDVLTKTAQSSWDRLAPAAYESALRSVFQR